MTYTKFVVAIRPTFLCARPKINIPRLSYKPGAPHVKSSPDQKRLGLNVQPLPRDDTGIVRYQYCSGGIGNYSSGLESPRVMPVIVSVVPYQQQ